MTSIAGKRKREKNGIGEKSAHKKPAINLNEIVTRVVVAAPSAGESKETATTNISAVFDGIVDALLEKIKTLQPTGIVGCMYWFTEPKLLSYLIEHKIPVQIIVQKQNLWARHKKGAVLPLVAAPQKKHKLSKKEYIAVKIREQYDSLTSIATELVDPIRCIGFLKSNCLMHHKFLVLLKDQTPVSVFTGSFNMTKNATQNLENALFIDNNQLALQYWNEWLNLLHHSESLDWTIKDKKKKL